MNVLVISHRRSGTHLTIDSIINNFPGMHKAEVVTLGDLGSLSKKRIYPDAVRKAFESGGTVFKTHLLPELMNKSLSDASKAVIRDVYDATKIIHVVRHPCDVLLSLFNYEQAYDPAVREMDLGDFLLSPHRYDVVPHAMNRMEYWAYHFNAWEKSRYSDRILLVRFESWLEDYAAELERVGSFLGVRPNAVLNDIRLDKSFDRTAEGGLWNKLQRAASRWIGREGGRTRMTSVLPSKGRKGSWKEKFTPEMLEGIPDAWTDILDQVGYSVDLSHS